MTPLAGHAQCIMNVTVSVAGFQAAEMPAVSAVIKVTLQKYVQNKYKAGTNPGAGLRYTATERAGAVSLR